MCVRVLYCADASLCFILSPTLTGIALTSDRCGDCTAGRLCRVYVCGGESQQCIIEVMYLLHINEQEWDCPSSDTHWHTFPYCTHTHLHRYVHILYIDTRTVHTLHSTFSNVQLHLHSARPMQEQKWSLSPHLCQPSSTHYSEATVQLQLGTPGSYVYLKRIETD